MNIPNFCVYKHTSPSGKVYIGITCQNPLRRWRDGKGYRQNEHFTNAILKYGWDNFKHEILFTGLTKEEACRIEIELIDEYGSADMDKGYNQSLGGDHGEYGEETRRKISARTADLWQNPDYRAHMSEAHKGKGISGWNHTEEAKAKMSAAVLTRCQNPDYRERLSRSAKKRASSSDEQKRLSANAHKLWSVDSKREYLRAIKKGNHNRAKKVQCVETGVIYTSTKAAAASVGASRDAIGQVCRGEREMSHGFHWRFYDDRR